MNRRYSKMESRGFLRNLLLSVLGTSDINACFFINSINVFFMFFPYWQIAKTSARSKNVSQVACVNRRTHESFPDSKKIASLDEDMPSSQKRHGRNLWQYRDAETIRCGLLGNARLCCVVLIQFVKDSNPCSSKSTSGIE